MSAFHRALRSAVCVSAALAPRLLRPWILSLVPGFDVHPTSSIGRSFLCPHTSLSIGPHARVGHLTVARNLDRLELGAYSKIGNLNSISGWPCGVTGDPYTASPDRVSELVLEQRARITNRHYLDCADSVRLEECSLVAGWRTVIITHGIHLASGEQRCSPIRIGRFSMVTTSCVVLGGSVLPAFCVLAPLSLLRKAHTDEYQLYAGNPAAPVRPIDIDSGVFRRLARDW